MLTRFMPGSIIVAVVTVALAISMLGGSGVSQAAQPEGGVDSDHLARSVAVIQYVRSQPTPDDVKADNISLLSTLNTVLADAYITDFITPYTEETSDQVKARLQSIAEEDRFIAVMVQSYRLSPNPLPLDSIHQLLALYYVEFFTTAEDLNASEEFLKREDIVSLAAAFDPADYAIPAPPPLKSTPAKYTQFVVDSAIALYEAQGLEATLAHYNRPESIDGQWYVFIIDENDLVIGHPDPERLGLDLKGWVGTDVNGYTFGPEMLSATEEGKWVSYVYRNPESGKAGSGEGELKNVWVKRHDGLLFASGWYIEVGEITKLLVSAMVGRFREGGLPATVASFTPRPGSVLAGLATAIAHYKAVETADGHRFTFIGDPNGKIVAHSDPLMIGGDTQDLFGGISFQADEDGG